MSGKRQHFIPQFLQNGFASHVNGDEVFTWVYRKGSKPFNTNIINVGVEGYFYSQEGDNQVDDDITGAERRFSVLIDTLRNEADKAVVDSETLAELIAHLETRTRHLRQSFATTGNVVLEELLRFIDNQEAFGASIKRRIQKDPSFLREAMAKELKKKNLPETLLESLLDNSQPLLDQMLPSILANLHSITNQFRANLPKMLKDASKLGHITALKQTLTPQAKTEQYNRLKYRVLKSTTTLLPLGDSTTVFQVEGERKFKAFCEKGDVLQAVYLPLSPNLILIGSLSEQVPDISSLPMAIAKCSLEYFIGSSSSEYNHLHSHVGECAYLLSEEQIDMLITEIINE